MECRKLGSSLPSSFPPPPLPLTLKLSFKCKSEGKSWNDFDWFGLPGFWSESGFCFGHQILVSCPGVAFITCSAAQNAGQGGDPTCKCLKQCRGRPPSNFNEFIFHSKVLQKVVVLTWQQASEIRGQAVWAQAGTTLDFRLVKWHDWCLSLA